MRLTGKELGMRTSFPSSEANVVVDNLGDCVERPV